MLRSRAKGSAYGWVIVIAGFFANGVAFGAQYTFGTFFKPIQEAFGWSRAEISLAITIHLVVYAAGSFLSGWAADRIGARKVVLAAAVLIGLGFGFASRITSLGQLYLLYGLPLALGIAACWTPVVAVLPGWFDKRGMPLGVFATGIGAGTLVMVPFTNSLIDSFGWRNAFWILGLICGLVVLGCGLLMQKPRPSPVETSRQSLNGVAPKAPARGMSLKAALRTRQLAYLFALQMLLSGALKMIMTHSVPYITDRGISASAAAVIVGVIGGASIVGRLVMGAVQDKLDARRALMACTALEAVTLVALPFIGTVPALMLFAVLFGFTYGGDVPQTPAITVAIFGTKNLGSIYGMVQVAAGVGGSVGPILAGYIFDLNGSYTAPFIIAGAGVALALLIAYRLRLPDAPLVEPV